MLQYVPQKKKKCLFNKTKSTVLALQKNWFESIINDTEQKVHCVSCRHWSVACSEHVYLPLVTQRNKQMFLLEILTLNVFILLLSSQSFIVSLKIFF